MLPRRGRAISSTPWVRQTPSFRSTRTKIPRISRKWSWRGDTVCGRAALSIPEGPKESKSIRFQRRAQTQGARSFLSCFRTHFRRWRPKTNGPPKIRELLLPMRQRQRQQTMQMLWSRRAERWWARQRDAFLRPCHPGYQIERTRAKIEEARKRRQKRRQRISCPRCQAKKEPASHPRTSLHPCIYSTPSPDPRNLRRTCTITLNAPNATVSERARNLSVPIYYYA